MKRFLQDNEKLMLDWDWAKNIRIGLDPKTITHGSGKIANWKCHKCGYEWKTSISHRSSGRGCPNCSGKVVVRGVNDFKTLYPVLANEWDYDKNDMMPDQVSLGSQKKAFWKCPNGHESYLSSPYQRRHGAGCPVCNDIFKTSFPEQAVLFYIKKVFPDVIGRYKNYHLFQSTMELDIYIPSINVGIEYDGFAWHRSEASNIRERKKYRICNENNIFLYRIREESASKENADKSFNIKRFNYEKCSELNFVIKTILDDLCRNKINVDIKQDIYEILQYRVIKKEKSLAFLYPEIAKEWYQERNGNLKPENILPGTSLCVWWKCLKCGNEWRGSVVNRTKGHGCDVCAREQRKITYHKTRLQTRELLSGHKCLVDWDFSKNKHTPDYYTKGSGEKVWWKCHKCGHEWKTSIFDRTRDRKNGCPACSNRILVRGKNDLATTNPNLVQEWNYELNGKLLPSDIAQWSHKKVWWLCPKCGYSYEATPSNRVFGKGCPCCRGRVVAKGFNDLATTRPDLTVDWHPTKNGNLKPSDVTKGRNIKIWWKCHICGHEWQDTINHRNGGRNCPWCKKRNKTISNRKEAH